MIYGQMEQWNVLITAINAFFQFNLHIGFSAMLEDDGIAILPLFTVFYSLLNH